MVINNSYFPCCNSILKLNNSYVVYAIKPNTCFFCFNLLFFFLSISGINVSWFHVCEQPLNYPIKFFLSFSILYTHTHTYTRTHSLKYHIVYYMLYLSLNLCVIFRSQLINLNFSNFSNLQFLRYFSYPHMLWSYDIQMFLMGTQRF